MYKMEDIIQYIHNQMTPEGKAAFESEMEKNPTLKQEVGTTRELRLYLLAQDKRESLKETSQIYFKTKRQNLNRLWVAGGVALVSILLILFYFLYTAQGKERNQVEPTMLFATYFKHEKAEATMGHTNDTSFLSCERLYNIKEYDKAIERLTAFLRTDPENLAAFSLLAKCYLETSEWEKAEILLAGNHANTDFQPFARWYRVGIALGKGDISAAKQRLKAVVESNDPDSERAAKILDQLAR